MKRTNLDALSAHYRIADYKELYTKVIALIDSQKIKPVKASGKNGKSPALYREYWIIEEKQDIFKYIYELNYEIVPSISTDYYRAHIDQYIQDRQWVLLLNDYIKNNDFMTRMSENERSFDIWHREKFLKQEQGKKILLRPLFHQQIPKIYNLNKCTELQRPIRKKTAEEAEELLDFDEKQWQDELERRKRERLKTYEDALVFLLDA